jgi:hypothetical protein
MTTVAQLTIEMAANVARLTTDMAAARRTVDNTFGAISKDVANLKNLLGGVFAGFGAQQSLGKIIEVQRQFDVLNSSLVTVTGSSMVAEQNMKWIREFAATTPYQLAEVTGAFVKMKALGLDASQAALASYGNTASAMGKGLNQMIEAVADAATGEFERLKEFGIRAKKEGDSVAFTFQGVTTNVRNSAQDITEYLQNLGNVSFSGAMEQRANTLDGAISNLADSFDALALAISQGGIGKALENDARTVSETMQVMTEVMIKAKEQGGGALTQIANAAGVLTGRAAFGGLAALFNTFNWTVNALTGNVLGLNENLSLLPDNLRPAAEQMKRMQQDLELARGEYDKLAARLAVAPDNIYIKSELAQLAKYINKLEEATKKQRQMQGALASIDGLDFGNEDAKFRRQMRQPVAPDSDSDRQSRARAAATAASQIAAAAKREEAEALRKVIELADHRNRLFDEEFQKEEAARMVVEGRIRSAREMLETIEQETRLMGLSGLEREKAVALLELERKGVEKGTEAYERLAPAILAAIEARSARAAGLMTVDEIIEEAARTAKTVGNNTSNTLADSISQGILEGARNGSNIMQIFKRELEAQFARTILRPMVQPVAEGMNSLISTGLNALLGAFGGGATSSGYNPGASMGFSTNWEQYMPSYAGGGHTGNGARSGGLDGQGGFMAMLHPRERVVDETQGSGNVVLNVITPPGQAMEARQSSRTSEDGTRIVELVLSAVGDSLANRSGAPARGLEAGYGLRPSMA